MTYDEAKKYLKDEIDSNKNLHSSAWYLHWDVGDADATLDGTFDATDLEAIAAYMRGAKSDGE